MPVQETALRQSQGTGLRLRRWRRRVRVAIGSGIGGLSRDLSAFWSNLTTVVSGDGIGRNSSGCFCGIALWHDKKVLHAISDSDLLIFRRSTRSRLALCELSIQLQLE